MPILARRCLSCTRDYELLLMNDELSALDRDDIENLSCPDCDSEDFESRLYAPTLVGAGDVGGYGKHYPYYDRGLLMTINSRQHRAQVLKQKGLVAVDGDIDLEKQHNADKREREKDEAEIRRMHEEQMRDPEIRRLIGRGWLKDQIDKERAEALRRNGHG